MLGDDLAEALPELQAEAESRMTLTLVAYSPRDASGAQIRVTDTNGVSVPGMREIGTTCGRIAGPSSATRDTPTRTVTVGGVSRPLLAAGLHIPLSKFVSAGVLQITAGDLTVGWQFEVTACGSAADDSTLVGRRYQVVGVPAKSNATSRRLDVVEV